MNSAVEQVFKNITVKSQSIKNVAQISDCYQAVFSNSKANNFFLSLQWMQMWIEKAECKPNLLEFYASDELVGFAFIGKQTSHWGDTYYLNQTGKHDDDQIWIEYNDVICQHHHKECRQALLSHITKQSGFYQFVVTNAIDQDWQHKHTRLWSSEATEGFSCSLDNEFYQRVFSKNTKSQIKRAQKFIEQHLGAVDMCVVSREHMEQAVTEMASLHIKQWGSHDYGSGFNNKRFTDFHRELLLDESSNNCVLIKVTAGETTLGYLYFFLQDQTAYFYLSAINYCLDDNRYKPGMLMHKLGMQYMLEQNMIRYDFLAGMARYKQSLSDTSYCFYNIKLVSSKWYHWPLRAMVWLKRKLQTVSKG